MKDKTIWHVGAWNRNYGDWVLQASIKENLKKVSDIPLDFVHVDCQNTYFSLDLIDRLNKEADLLLIGGGGLIFNRPEDNSLSGWQFNIDIDDIRKIKVPIVIYGIGYNQFHYDDRGFKNILNEHLIATQEASALFSVRNHGTKDELIKRGLVQDDITVVPDAGSFLEPKNITISDFDQDRMKIGLNWVQDRPFYTFPEPYKRTQKEVLSNVIEALKYMITKYNAQIVNIEHIASLDDYIKDLMVDELGKDNFISIERDAPHLFPPSNIFAPFLVDIYKQMDVVIGMRGHANIIPFGVMTPFLALGSHNKNKFFLEEIGEEELLLDIREYQVACSKENIIKKLETLIQDKDKYVNRFSSKKKILQKQFDDFNKRIFKLLIEKERGEYSGKNE